MPTPLLKVRNLVVTLEAKGASRRLLSDVSFDLKDRQVLCIIGESGSGKTVLSRALVNWISPPLRIAGGNVEFHGRDLLSFPTNKSKRSMAEKLPISVQILLVHLIRRFRSVIRLLKSFWPLSPTLRGPRRASACSGFSMP